MILDKEEKRQRRQARRRARRLAQKQAEQVSLHPQTITPPTEISELNVPVFTRVCGSCGKHFMPWDSQRTWEKHTALCQKKGYGTRISQEALAAFRAENAEEIAAAKAEKRRRRRERKARRKVARQQAAIIRN